MSLLLFSYLALKKTTNKYCQIRKQISCHVFVFRGQRQITEQNSTHVCLTGAIPNFIIFDKMKDKLVVNSITEFDRYWSGNSRVTADLLSDLTVLIRGFFQRKAKHLEPCSMSQ